MRTMKTILFFSGLVVLLFFIVSGFCDLFWIAFSASPDSGNVGDKILLFFHQPLLLLIPEIALMTFFVLSMSLPKTKEWANEQLYKLSSVWFE